MKNVCFRSIRFESNEASEEERNANCKKKRVERETSSQSVSVDHKFVCTSKLNIKPRTRLKNVSR